MIEWLTKRRKAELVFKAMVGNCDKEHHWGMWKIDCKKKFLDRYTYIQRRTCLNCGFTEWNKQVINWGF